MGAADEEMTRVDQYGSWPSVIGPAQLAAASAPAPAPLVDPDDPSGSIYLLCSAPASSSGGRSGVAVARVRTPAADVADVVAPLDTGLDTGVDTALERGLDSGFEAQSPEIVTPQSLSVRSRHNEYGGGAAAVRGGILLVVEDSTQRIWRIDVGPSTVPTAPTTPGSPTARSAPTTPAIPAARPITPESDQRVRFAGMCLDPERGIAWAVREDQRDPALEPVADLVRLDLDGPNEDFGTVVRAGARRRLDPASGDRDAAFPAPDFVLDPVLSPGRGRLAWIEWSHPDMPWDGSRVMVADLTETGDLAGVHTVAGVAGTCCATEPVWIDEDRLAFLDDRTGFALPYLATINRDPSGDQPPAVTLPLARGEVEFGLPAWVSRQRAMIAVPGVNGPDRLAVVAHIDGFAKILLVDVPTTGELPDARTLPSLDERVVSALGLQLSPDGAAIICDGGFADRPGGTLRVPLDGSPASAIHLTGDPIDPAYLPTPQPLSWPGHGGEETHGFYYSPAHPTAHAPDGPPPLVVMSHGGPTSATSPAMRATTAYFTSRGIGVLDVNYGGSTGYGRAYRERLDGQWGIVDVTDCVAGARHLVDQGLADGTKLAIRGGSAGGFTTLAALTFHDVFTAGMSRYGIGDLSALARDTHKFESRYTDGLVGPWPAAKAIYAERSPIEHVDGLSCPMLLLQGEEDKVVPPNQARAMAEAVRAKGLPVTLEIFPGEGHGFRDPATVQRAWQLELDFLAEVWGFTPAAS